MNTPRFRLAPARPGTARAALGSPDFRTLWSANFLSSVGTWMQNVVLPAYIYTRTDSAATVGLLIFAQLGPLLFLSIPSGMIADRLPLKRWLVFTQGIQMTFSVLLGVATQMDAAVMLLFAMQLGVGIGNALNAPAAGSLLPNLVPPENLGGAIALNSVLINGSRVIGPVIVAALMTNGVTTAQVFYINAATYLFTMWAIRRITVPTVQRRTETGSDSLLLGIRTVRAQPDLARVLLTMATFSFFSLPFVGLFPAVSRLNFGIDEGSTTYKWLFATWGLGAMIGALAVGTVFAARDKRRLTRQMMLAFAVWLALFGASSSALPAFVTGFFLGFAYFAATTSLLTVLQSRLEPSIRGRVLSLWFMSFGGTVPLGNLAFGPVMDAIGARPVLLGGAVWALWLAWWCDIAAIDRRTGRDSAR